MNKILKRLLTGVLTLATVFTALPTTAVHAAETQYWTESEERVGIVEKVMNDGSIGSTFNEGHMTVEGEDAYCIDINTGFKNGYKTRSDASTRMTADQIEDVALYLVIVPVGILLGANAQDYKSFTMTFIFYLLFVPAIAGILNKIMYISESFMQIDGNVARMDEIFNIPVLPQTTSPKKTQKDDVVFDNVSFTYTGKKEEMAIENVSFKANQGQITAIVGLSGGGKSTIANLISRFWDVTEGSVKIGGVDIRDISEKDLMNHVSFVFQDIFLFKQSILDNIRMGNPNATEEQVIEAAKAAQCHEFISKLPNGYKTVFGTKGIHLSGGERQRIAIARAIIKDSPIIVLDEATAFSDPENEYLIQKAFEKLMQNKTVIIIAHRLSTIRNADKIIVMEKGHLVEEGKHNELVAAGGRYSQMWNHYTEAVDWKISGKAV